MLHRNIRFRHLWRKKLHRQFNPTHNLTNLMNDLTQSSPFPPIRHEKNPFSSTDNILCHGHGMTTRVYSRLSINQLLERITRIDPHKSRCTGRRTEELTVFLSPIDENSS